MGVLLLCDTRKGWIKASAGQGNTASERQYATTLSAGAANGSRLNTKKQTTLLRAVARLFGGATTNNPTHARHSQLRPRELLMAAFGSRE
jgi:hypothetical protein